MPSLKEADDVGLRSDTSVSGRMIAHEECPRNENDDIEEKLKRLYAPYILRLNFSLWVLGVINNFHYCLVISAADNIATGYGMKSYVALISWANIFFGIVARIANAFIFTRVSYNVRITIMTISTMLGLLLIALAGPMGRGSNVASFIIMLFGVVVSGTACSYGESVILGFIQRYPATLVGAWSSGTGLSGVAAALIYIALREASLSNAVIFYASMPFCVIYWIAYMVGLVVMEHTVVDGDSSDPSHIPSFAKDGTAVGEISMEDGLSSCKMLPNIFGTSWRSIPKSPTEKQAYGEETEGLPAAADGDHPSSGSDQTCGLCPASLRRWWRNNKADLKLMHNSMLWFLFNLAVVYVAEYAAQFVAPFSFYCRMAWKDKFWMKHSYTISQLCYQVGVLISRSSLLCVKIRAVGVISIIQVINAIGWLLQAKLLFISSTVQQTQFGLTFLLFGWMVFVGLLGGASYVNVFYLVLRRCDKMQQAEEEELTTFQPTAQEDVSPTEDGGPVRGNPSQPTSDVAEDRREKVRKEIALRWHYRRELGMNIGAIYATIGSTLGSVVDVIYANTILKGDSGVCV